MFDLDAGKLLIIGIVALVVIPPKDLPSVMRQAGQALGKLRRMAAEFQSQFMDAIREAELDEIRKDVAKLADSAKLAVDFDPVATVRDEIKGALGEAATGTTALGVESAIASNDPGTSMPSTDMKLPPAVDDEAAAAGIAPLAPSQDGDPQGGDTMAAIPHMAAEPAAMAPSAPQPSAEPAAAAQEADARRS
jgi:sec-independent protein translocase protein TatB